MGPILSSSGSRVSTSGTAAAIGVADLGDQVAGQLLAGSLDRPDRDTP
jgi:hypothetical protein